VRQTVPHDALWVLPEGVLLQRQMPKRRLEKAQVRVRGKGGTLRLHAVHGLYQCSKEGCYIRWDRDKNAAINIRNVFLSICTTRLPPLQYQRGFKME
jgi:hypothetical protein